MDARSPDDRRTAFPALDTVEALETIYGVPNDASTEKVAHWITPPYRTLIEKSPFAALATVGPEGLDCSPRGDVPGFIRVHDDTTLLIPDRRGNNRIDSLRNVVRDPRIALMLLIPGSINALRINGRGYVTADEALRMSFDVEGKAPRTVIVMTVEEIYFQCGRALIRSGLWDPSKQVAQESLPTPGEILASMTEGRVGGEAYDRAWPERAKASMW
ncbi:pyridoxamine 5'-phosphate oxidase family protein [Rhodopseudomonas palustris]|uniref:Pyridoxamine 5'-phosphate oxidase family protein n=1 Tax=Rhodopseudomonas palustris TaxID=1076 RepID=A0AAX3E017_RHOPL|nr:pyridoxamine 5'-phosphate oxidase family protein [Rhodopseudomonas palustris]UYO40404.1 pyridoxamine 5'-phosphate oxidase family protein [Rhodopseudomonas palustris]